VEVVLEREDAVGAENWSVGEIGWLVLKLRNIHFTSSPLFRQVLLVRIEKEQDTCTLKSN
jgi:hypothetical protein